MLENLEETIKSSSDDVYHEYQHVSKLDLIKMVGCAHRNGAEYVVPLASYNLSNGSERKVMEYSVDDSPPSSAVGLMLKQSDQIKVSLTTCNSGPRKALIQQCILIYMYKCTSLLSSY